MWKLEKVLTAENNGKQALIKCNCGVINVLPLEQWLKLDASNGCEQCTLKNRKVENRTPLFKILYSRLKSKARRYKREMTLSQQEMIGYYTKPCHYCNTPYSNTIYKDNDRTIYLNYNGIDRVDSSKGYIQGNCVTSCKRCNTAKNDLPAREFEALISRIYLNHINTYR